MKAVIYRDRNGFLRRSLVRDNDSEEDADIGIPDGPPDVTSIDWQAIQKQINDLLVNENIQTSIDLQRKRVFPTIANIVNRYIMALYREEDRRKAGKL